MSYIQQKQSEIKNSILNSFTDSEIEKGGKPAVVGEHRTFSGKEYTKTTHVWKLKSGGKSKNATDHLIEEGEHHFVDTLHPETGKVVFKPGDSIHYKDSAGNKCEGVISEEKGQEDGVLKIKYN